MSRIYRRTHDHSGWTSEEDALLFSEVAKYKSVGKPLKAAFDIVADLTGRRANSIRNYYYLRIRDEDIIRKYEPCKASQFVPFTDEEVETLLRRLLSDQAKGISVRASTMAMSDGDMTAMLRYQNKYRSLLKTEPELIQKVIEAMRSEGKKAFDPYNDEPHHRSGRPKKEHTDSEKLLDVVSDTVNELYNVEGLNVHALFESLGALAKSAAKGATAVKRLYALENADDKDTAQLLLENEELKRIISEKDAENAELSHEISALTEAMQNLVSVNNEFLEMSGVSKVSYLSSYINELTGAISQCSLPVAN